MKPSRAALEFEMPGHFVHVKPVGCGNVNDTYEAVFRAGPSVDRMILQRINHNVFTKPDWIMANMRRVTEHLAARVLQEDSAEARLWAFPSVIPTRGGADFYVDADGAFWRAMTLIEEATAYPKVRNAEHAFEAGVVLGCFHRMISDLDPGQFRDTLPGFHICPQYLAKYDATVLKEGIDLGNGGAPEVDRLMAFIVERRKLAGLLEDAASEGELRTRLIHGDPKVDNIMMDDFTGKGIGIIDLDTVKPGLIHYDFGDALRSICNPAGEDASDLGDVVFDIDLCEAFVKGYLVNARRFLTEQDHRYLYHAIHVLTFELGLRFFQDYLAGDVYFKVQFEDHNLNRARVQFKLCESIELNEKQIRHVIDRELASLPGGEG